MHLLRTQGMARAKAAGFVDWRRNPGSFDAEAYLHYEQVCTALLVAAHGPVSDQPACPLFIVAIAVTVALAILRTRSPSLSGPANSNYSTRGRTCS